MVVNDGARTLKSLSRFVDVVFALAFFRAIEFLPLPQNGELTTSAYGVFSVIASSPANLTRVVFCLIVIVYYWARKNALAGIIETANGTFALLSVSSLAALCVFFYAFAADPTYVGGWPTLLLQSASLLVASALSYAALRYAIYNELVPVALKASAEQTARVDLSNPLTALIATALAWSGLTIWTISWFVFMPLLAVLLKKWRF